MTEKRQGHLSTQVRFALEKIQLARLSKEFSTLDLLLDWLFPIPEKAKPEVRDEIIAKRKAISDRIGEWSDWNPGSAGPKPGKSVEIFQAIVDRFELRDRTTAIHLMECGLREYLGLLTGGNSQEYEKVYRSAPDLWPVIDGGADQKQNVRMTGKQKSGTHHHGLAQGLHVVHYDLDIDFDVAQGIEELHVDQKYLYIEKYSAEGWNARIAYSGSRYPYYRYCTDSLIAFLKDGPTACSEWASFVAEGKICTTVMLGAGSPDKDIIILNSFERSPAYGNGGKRLNHLIVDTSMNMLAGTARGICDSAKGARSDPHHYDFLDLITVCGDFDKLGHIWKKLTSENVALRRPGANVAFFMPGLTFTNINEAHFLDELGKVVQPGDILVLGVEFIDPTDEKFSDTVMMHYAPEAVYELFIPSIFWLLMDEERKFVINNPKDKVIKVHPIDESSYERFLKHVKGVTVTLETGVRSILLASSRRYVEDEFIALLADRGFTPFGRFANGSTTYRQAAFQRI